MSKFTSSLKSLVTFAKGYTRSKVLVYFDIIITLGSVSALLSLLGGLIWGGFWARLEALSVLLTIGLFGCRWLVARQGKRDDS